MSKHLFFDFETIGANSTRCPAVECSYAIIEWERFTTNPYTFAELITDVIVKDKLNVSEQVKNFGARYTKEDMKFWERLPKEAQANLKPSPKDLSAEQFVNKFIDNIRKCGKVNHWWSRSNSFDPVILMRLAEYAGQYELMGEYLPHGKVRDTRTFIDAKLDFPAKNGFVPLLDDKYWHDTFVAHDSTHDVAADILRFQSIIRAENDLDQLTR